jgi:phosphoglycerate kinase
MPVTTETMLAWCRDVLGADADAPRLSLAQYLAAIPQLDSLADVPSGTPVLVRGDLDAKPGPNVGDGDLRLRSMLDTLNFGRRRGWKQIVFGHIGREPEKSLAKVAARLAELLGCDVPLICDWWNEATALISETAAAAARAAAPGSVLLLENVRRYAVERVLWKAKPADLPGLAERLTRFANQFAERLGRVFVNEALSAGSLDASTLIVPAAMDRAVLGSYVAHEFAGPMMRCLAAQLVVFSGLKADKLDDLEAIIDRGLVRWVFAAGSLAMALLKAAADLAGKPISIGVAEDPSQADKPYYIGPDRIEQARRMLTKGRSTGIEFVLPVDFVLADGRAVDAMTPTDQQFDVGPKTSALFEQQIGQFIASTRETVTSTGSAVAFHNGVFGMFEDPRFAEGTRRFVAQLKRLTDAGIEVYIGGGEGGTALELYGQPNWVQHCFTAGGTVLNALGSSPVPYLVALRQANQRRT